MQETEEGPRLEIRKNLEYCFYFSGKLLATSPIPQST